MTLGKACDHAESRRGLWDEERGRKWAGWRRVVAAGLLVPSLNGELQRPPTEPQAKGLYLPCLSVLTCYRVPCVWIPFLDPRPDGLGLWTRKPALDTRHPPFPPSALQESGPSLFPFLPGDLLSL